MCVCVCVCVDEYKSELGQQLSLIAGSLVCGVVIVSLVAIAIICTRYAQTNAHAHPLHTLCTHTHTQKYTRIISKRNK